MNETPDTKEAADRLVDFAEFFLRLGELNGQQVLTSIATESPEFTHYCDSLENQPQTLIELFRLYGRWEIDRLKKESGAAWNEIVERAQASERYRLLKMQWQQTSLLWEEWEQLIVHD